MKSLPPSFFSTVKGCYDITAVEDCFVKQAKVPELIKQYKFDSESMVNKIVEKITEV